MLLSCLLFIEATGYPGKYNHGTQSMATYDGCFFPAEDRGLIPSDAARTPGLIKHRGLSPVRDFLVAAHGNLFRESGATATLRERGGMQHPDGSCLRMTTMLYSISVPRTMHPLFVRPSNCQLCRVMGLRDTGIKTGYGSAIDGTLISISYLFSYLGSNLRLDLLPAPALDQSHDRFSGDEFVGPTQPSLASLPGEHNYCRKRLIWRTDQAAHIEGFIDIIGGVCLL